jgi:hypothetical protein
VNLERITSATLSSSIGSSHTFRPGETQWLLGSRIVRRASGIEETKILYSVESVMLEGSNVVNSKEQRFYASPNLVVPIPVLLYSVRLRARDAGIGVAIGSAIHLKHPDGRLERYPIGSDGEFALTLLPRGEYVATVDAPGMSFPQPIALSKDQDAELKVVSYYDIAAAVLLLASLALGLLLIGRPRFFTTVVPLRTSLAYATGPFLARLRQREQS